MINLVDIFATVQELTSERVLPPKEAGADSYSFYDELIGKRNGNAIRPHMVVNSGSGVVALRKGPWKYIEGVPQREGAKNDKPQLYNLETDITETKDCIHEHPEIYDDLKSTLDNIRALGSERLNTKK
jgi:arylsulfatase A-like enzyme